MKCKFFSFTNVFIVLTILAAWWITAKGIEPFLHFHSQQIGFLTTFGFFKSYTTYPGGIADYVAEFVSQFFSYNSFGSLLIIAIASLQGFIALDIVTPVDRINQGEDFRFLPLFYYLEFIVLCDYRYPLLCKYQTVICIYFHMGLLLY